MSTVAEIESAISALPLKDARRVADWLQEYLDAKWDKEMDADIAAGRLDPLWEKAKARSLDHATNNLLRALKQDMRSMMATWTPTNFAKTAIVIV